MEINEGEVICPKCNGTGQQKDCSIVWIPGYGFKGGISYKCKKCHGKGNLDWIENIVGIKEPIMYEDSDIVIVEYEDFPWKIVTRVSYERIK